MKQGRRIGDGKERDREGKRNRKVGGKTGKKDKKVDITAVWGILDYFLNFQNNFNFLEIKSILSLIYCSISYSPGSFLFPGPHTPMVNPCNSPFMILEMNKKFFISFNKMFLINININ
jgi:hypothetical protein